MKCSEIDDLLEAHIDEDLTPEINRKVNVHISMCTDCRAKFEMAKHIAGELRSLPLQRCPDSVVQKVFAKIPHQKKTRLGRSLPSLFHTHPKYALGFSFGLVVILIAFISLSIYHPGLLFNGHQPHYTDEEIAQAKKDIYLALEYVNYATSRTQHIIEKDVVPKKVIRPIQRSLDHIHLSMKKGEPS